MLLERYDLNVGGLAVSDDGLLLGDRIDSRKAYFTKLHRSAGAKGGVKRNCGGVSRRGNSFADRGFSQRVVVKAHFKKHSSGSAGAGNLRGHLGYITRDGAGVDEERPALFGSVEGGENDLSRSAFYNKCKDDRHHFRLIISPENGHQIDDFEGYIGKVMSHVEGDLDTKLEWVSAIHYDTDHVHAHVVLRGRDDKGRDLVIAPDYISNGIRDRAREVATEIIGERSLEDLQRGMEEEVNALRVTSLDHFIERRGVDIEDDAGDSVEMNVNVRDLGRSHRDEFHGNLVRKRLEFLTTTSMAHKVSRDIYHVRKDFMDELRQASEKHDVIKQLYRSMPDEEQGVSIYKANDHGGDIVRGRIEKIAHMNELTDHKYMVVRDDEDNLHYVPLADNDRNASLLEGSIVEVSAGTHASEKADRNILKIAFGNDGIYTRDAHLSHVEKSMKFIKDPEGYVDYHGARLERLVNAAIVDVLDDGGYLVPETLVEQGIDITAEIESKSRKRQYAQVKSLSVSPLSYFSIYDINDEDAPHIQGRIEKIGRVNNHSDKKYMAVRDGNEVLHYVPLTSAKQNKDLSEGAIVDVSTGAYKGGADYNISKIALANDGVYMREVHHASIENSKKEIDDIVAYLDAHETRLKTLAGAGIVEERGDGSFVVPEDVIDRGEVLNKEIGADSKNRAFAKVNVISAMPIESQIDVHARTFLDLEIYRHQKGYKLSYETADRVTLDGIHKRQDWLVENDYAYHKDDTGEFVMKGDALGKLYDVEIDRAGKNLGNAFGRKFSSFDFEEEQIIRYLGFANIQAGRHMVIGRSNELSLIKMPKNLSDLRVNEPLSIVSNEQGLKVEKTRRNISKEEAILLGVEKSQLEYKDLVLGEPVIVSFIGAVNLEDGMYAAVKHENKMSYVKVDAYPVYSDFIELSAGDNGFTNIKEVDNQRELDIEHSKAEIEKDDDDWWD